MDKIGECGLVLVSLRVVCGAENIVRWVGDGSGFWGGLLRGLLRCGVGWGLY